MVFKTILTIFTATTFVFHHCTHNIYLKRNFNYVVEYSELQIADETILQFNVSKVMKRGGSTGETEGLLTGNTFSVCVDKDFNIGGFYYFAKCFSIKSISRPFFERGDSGSGVFLMENGTPTKPLGIAFAKLLIRHNTAVCRIDKIAEAFGLSVYQHEEPMEI